MRHPLRLFLVALTAFGSLCPHHYQVLAEEAVVAEAVVDAGSGETTICQCDEQIQKAKEEATRSAENFQNEISGMASTVESIRTKLTNAEQLRENAETRSAKLESELQVDRQKLSDMMVQHEELTMAVAQKDMSSKEELKNLQTKLENVKEKFRQSEMEKNEAMQSLSTLQNKYDRLSSSKDSTIDALRSEISDHEKTIERHAEQTKQSNMIRSTLQKESILCQQELRRRERESSKHYCNTTMVFQDVSSTLDDVLDASWTFVQTTYGTIEREWIRVWRNTSPYRTKAKLQYRRSTEDVVTMRRQHIDPKWNEVRKVMISWYDGNMKSTVDTTLVPPYQTHVEPHVLSIKTKLSEATESTRLFVISALQVSSRVVLTQIDHDRELEEKRREAREMAREVEDDSPHRRGRIDAMGGGLSSIASMRSLDDIKEYMDRLERMGRVTPPKRERKHGVGTTRGGWPHQEPPRTTTREEVVDAIEDGLRYVADNTEDVVHTMSWIVTIVLVGMLVRPVRKVLMFVLFAPWRIFFFVILAPFRFVVWLFFAGGGTTGSDVGGGFNKLEKKKSISGGAGLNNAAGGATAASVGKGKKKKSVPPPLKKTGVGGANGHGGATTRGGNGFKNVSPSPRSREQ